MKTQHTRNYKNVIALVVAIALIGVIPAGAGNAQGGPAFDPRYDINGDGTLNISDVSALSAAIEANYGAQATPATPAPATATAAPVTATAQPATATPAPTVAPATATPMPMGTPQSGGAFTCQVTESLRNFVCPQDIEAPPAVLPAAGALTGQSCPRWVHDQYLVTMAFSADKTISTQRVTSVPAGSVAWRTWHPAIDPTYGCGFLHEHGMNPTLSQADPSWPAFGWEAHMHGMVEPHEGFKIAYANNGDFDPDAPNRKMIGSGLLMFHMGSGSVNTTIPTNIPGTPGLGRVTQQFHSFRQVLRGADGRLLVDVRGQANTGLFGNICQRDDSLNLNSNPDDDILRTFGEPSAKCAKDQSYEIWSGRFFLQTWPGEWSEVNFSMAIFDPITVLNRVNGVVMIERNPAGGLGCERESYMGSVFRRVPVGGNFYSDATGNTMPQNDPRAIRQFIAKGQGAIVINTDASTAQVFKTRVQRDTCTPFLKVN
jgi:hypothetical protein